MKTLVEIHALQNFAPANLNRDDTGAPKDAFFGGTRRARVSSQCLKRAVRQYFRELTAQKTLPPESAGVRTKRVLEAVTARLVGLGRGDLEAAEKARLALGATGLSVKEGGKSEYLLFLGNREISNLAAVIHEKWDAIVAPEAIADDASRKSAKAKKQQARTADPELKAALDRVLDGGKAVDVALFGRMLADMPEKNQSAACQVAHAISTHAVEREFDFYTAVDDLKPEDTAGADMMGTVEFNSACLYRYAVVDWERLVENLQGDRELAARALRGFLEGFVIAEPSGKQNTFAAHNPPEFVAVSVRSNCAPRSLANAFERAIRPRTDETVTKASAVELVKKAKLLESAYGGSGETLVLDLVGIELDGFAEPVTTLVALLDRTSAAVEESASCRLS